MTERWYRFYDGTQYADGSLSFECRSFDVLDHTPKGVWLLAQDEDNGVHGDRKFVLQPHYDNFEQGGDPGRRFAYPTEEMALYSYRKRKEWHVRRLQQRLDKAARLSHALENGLYRPPRPSKPGEFVFTFYRVTDGRDEELRVPEW